MERRAGGSLMRLLAALMMMLVLSGCATILRGTEQQVSVNTNPTGAQVQFSNGISCNSPCNLKAKRDQALVITISKDECQTQTASMIPMLAGAGVVFGGLIDYGTGAVYDLQPNPLTVTLSCERTANRGAPAIVYEPAPRRSDPEISQPSAQPLDPPVVPRRADVQPGPVRTQSEQAEESEFEVRTFEE